MAHYHSTPPPCDLCGQKGADTEVMRHPAHRQCKAIFLEELASFWNELDNRWQQEIKEQLNNPVTFTLPNEPPDDEIPF